MCQSNGALHNIFSINVIYGLIILSLKKIQWYKTMKSAVDRRFTASEMKSVEIEIIPTDRSAKNVHCQKKSMVTICTPFFPISSDGGDSTPFRFAFLFCAFLNPIKNMCLITRQLPARAFHCVYVSFTRNKHPLAEF